MPRDIPKRIELLPDADPEAVRAALRPAAEPEPPKPEFELDEDDPDAVWLLGEDPEAKISRIADRRSVIKRRAKSEGAQFVYGLLVLAAALGAVALAATIQTLPFIIVAAVVFPAGVFWFRSRWRRWLGAAPYMYRLMTSLGEDAENILVEHEQKQRRKYVKQIGDLYEHTRPKD
ncbi:MAG: hypothetical protein LAT64_00500 [Phycisphaerales bacterium]|nr:hypothetical protein [Planctomycetota bacterium]MCH8507241.1 hypothetical protein [Phycisphaerales bacterium]